MRTTGAGRHRRPPTGATAHHRRGGSAVTGTLAPHTGTVALTERNISRLKCAGRYPARARSPAGVASRMIFPTGDASGARRAAAPSCPHPVRLVDAR